MWQAWMGEFFARTDSLKPLSHYADDKPRDKDDGGTTLSKNLLAAFLSRWPSDTPPPTELLPSAAAAD